VIEFLNGPAAELKDFFKPEFAKGLTTNGTKLEIDSFTSGVVGKFVGLYGLDDMIESIPDTITVFSIQNRDNKEVLIKIPESISRFQNLETLLLKNCISEIPDSVCQIKSLNFISLLANPKLKTVPACIADLPNLVFINLKDSNNVVVPDSIQQKGTKMGNNMWDFED
jgi:Leucine-rich repeat (LRR) protein